MPSPRIAAAATMPAYASIVDDCLQTARKQAGEGASDEAVAALNLALERQPRTARPKARHEPSDPVPTGLRGATGSG